MNLCYKICVCRPLTQLKPHFEPLYNHKLPDTYAIKFLACFYLWSCYLSVPHTLKVILPARAFMKIRCSPNKRAQCSFDRWCCDLTLINQTYCLGFFLKSLARALTSWGVGGGGGETWLKGEVIFFPTIEFLISFYLGMFSAPNNLIKC